MKTRFRAALLATACALVFFTIGGLMPIWTIESRSKANRVTKIDYRGYPIWTAPNELFAKGEFRLRNFYQAGILASVVLLVWVLVYHMAAPRRRPDPVGDYEEKPDGAIPDGRAPPG